MMPEAPMRKRFLKFNPPPDMISVDTNHIQSTVMSPNPIAFPIPNEFEVSSLEFQVLSL